MNNKKTIIGVSALVLVGLIIFLFGTYAWWTTTKKQTNRNVVTSACLNISYENETGEFNMPDVWPKTDTEGLAQTPYTFTITNECDHKITYEVYLESVSDPNKPNNTTDENYYLASNYIKVTFDDSEPTLYSKLQTSTSDTGVRETKKLMSRTLLGHATNKHKLTFWIDENTPLENGDGSTNTNRAFLGKIKVIAGQNTDHECYAIDTDGMLLNYDWECGPEANIPATVDNIPVTSIGSNTFETTLGPTFKYVTDLTPEQMRYENIYFGIGASKDILIAYDNNDMQALSQMTSDDIAYVSYKDEEKDRIEDAIDKIMSGQVSLEDWTIGYNARVISSQIGLELNDTIYSSNDENLPNMAAIELYTLINENGTDRIVLLAQYNNSEYSDIKGYRTNTNLWGYTHLWNIDLSHAFHLNTIGASAFDSCFSQNPLDIPANVTSIGSHGLFNYSSTVTVHNQAIYNTRDTWMRDSHLVVLDN